MIQPVAQPMTDKPASPSIPPVAPVRPTVTTVHGQRLQDDYAWLKAENWHDVLRDPNRLPADIRAYLEDENAYSAGLIGRVSGLQSQLVAEMRGRIKEDDTSVPEKDGPFAYFVRHRTGGQHQLYCRSERAGGDPVVLLDGDALAAGKPFYHLGGRRHSDDHKLLAWSCDEAGSEFYAIRVRDMTSLDDLGDLITETTGHVVWDKQGRQFPLCRRRREPSSPPGEAPRRGHADERRYASSTRRRSTAGSSTSTAASPATSPSSSISDHETSEVLRA